MENSFDLPVEESFSQWLVIATSENGINYPLVAAHSLCFISVHDENHAHEKDS